MDEKVGRDNKNGTNLAWKHVYYIHESWKFKLKFDLHLESFCFKKVWSWSIWTIAWWYGHQQSLVLQACVLSPHVWAIAQVIFDTLGMWFDKVFLIIVKVIGYFLMCFFVDISFASTMWVDSLSFNYGEK